MKLTRLRAVAAAGVVLALAAAGCSGGGSDSESGRSGQLIYGEPTDFPENLFPSIAAGNATSVSTINGRILPAPYKVLPDFTFQWDKDYLAEEPTEATVGGKQTITYKINPDAVWSDGEPISAKDFEYAWSIQKSSDPAAGGCGAILSTTGWDQIESVEGADGDKTVTVTYSKPYPDWKQLFTLFPSHLMDKATPEEDCTAITTGWPIADGYPSAVSGGPWQLEKDNIDVDGKIVTLTPNPKWWGEGPQMERLIISNIGNDAAGNVKAMQNGDVGMIYPQPQLDLVKQLKELEPDVTTKIEFGLSFEHMDLNTRNPHLAIPAVRQAIALGLDRTALVDQTVGQFDSRAQVLNNRYWMNNQPQYEDTSDGKYDEADVAAAQAKLAEAGYTKGADGIYTHPTNGPLALEMMTTVNNPLRESTIDVVTAQLKEVGIQINKFLNPDIFAGAEKPKSLEAGGFDIALFAWVAAPVITQSISLYRSSTAEAPGQNYTLGSDPRVDTLMDSLATELDASKWGPITAEADRHLWEDMFTIPLYQKPTLLSYGSQYENVEDNATTAGPLWNSELIATKQ